MKTLLVCVLLGGLCGVANAAPKAADPVAAEAALTAEIAQHKAAIKALQEKRKAIKAQVRKAKQIEKAKAKLQKLEQGAVASEELDSDAFERAECAFYGDIEGSTLCPAVR